MPNEELISEYVLQVVLKFLILNLITLKLFLFDNFVQFLLVNNHVFFNTGIFTIESYMIVIVIKKINYLLIQDLLT